MTVENPKTAVVTGATGFIGSHLVRRLINLGWRVHGLKRQTSAMSLVSDVAQKISWHDLDVTSLDDIWESIGEADVVYHLATQYGRGDVPASDVVKTNLLFPIQLLEQADKRNVPLFVATDTCFPSSYPYLRSYTLSKEQFAQWGKEWSERTANKFVNLVLQHPYGPGDQAGKFVPWIINQCQGDVAQIELTSGEQKKDFIFVDDVIEALVVLHSSQDQLANFSEVPCGSGEAVSLRHFVETIHSVSNSSSQLMFGSLPSREGELQVSYADIEQLNQLGWQPTTSLMSGIRLTLKANDQILASTPTTKT